MGPPVAKDILLEQSKFPNCIAGLFPSCGHKPRAVDANGEGGEVTNVAPATFLIALVIIAGVIWVALSWSYSTRIENLESRISLREDQIAYYKSKLNEAKKRLDALEIKCGN
jgi:hypothetical protein